MTTTRQLIACAAATLLSLGAHAAMPVNAADLPRISNGGTGFIGLTASAGTPRARYVPSSAEAGVPTQAGEASTLVQGVPNREPTMAMQRGSTLPEAGRPELRTMGQRGMAGAAVNPAWGTPK